MEARPADIKSQDTGLTDEEHWLPETLLVEEPFSALVNHLNPRSSELRNDRSRDGGSNDRPWLLYTKVS